MKTESMYEAYNRAMLRLVKDDEDIVLLYADFPRGVAGEYLQNNRPERIIDVGIAEANLITTAAGVAAAGKKPFTHCHSIFAVGRAYNQIRQNVCFDDLNVKIVLCNSGMLWPFMGGSHQTVEEIAVMRVIPNLTLVSPADAVSAQRAAEALNAQSGPAVMRLAPAPVPELYTKDDHFELGKAIRLAEGGDVTVVATGACVFDALTAVKSLAEKGIKARLLDMHTIKPLDEEELRKAAVETGAIVTVEDSSVIGGLGGAVAEFTAGHCPAHVKRVGVMDLFGQSGSLEELKERYEISPAHIATAVETVLRSAK
jgi:transketolase